MPLRTTDRLLDPSELDEVSEKYIIFYSSKDADGKLWCPYCRAIDSGPGGVQDTFGKANGPSALIAYVGTKLEWKRPAEHRYRSEPWNVTGVPTLVKLEEGKITHLDINEELEALSGIKRPKDA
ncbi:hypothetical protein FIBSPDRAFT_947281 [Athelia psychrophila]|uniref:Thioredoxin domain-containing protein n=1 Tax=Athelia psychrophila TaxID=1759441 RepID=A0A166S0K6_9AGAM|nr:hypothetical protein FIBSPDRAFT_947281 [Fibularhizoctonia sp. CBS 109695]